MNCPRTKCSRAKTKKYLKKNLYRECFRCRAPEMLRLIDNRVKTDDGLGAMEGKDLQAGQTDSLKEICHGKMLFSVLLMMLEQRCR